MLPSCAAPGEEPSEPVAAEAAPSRLAAHDAPALQQSALSAQTLEQYAAACDQAIGATVPDFDCEEGSLIPTTHFADGKCDRPNQLNQVCDPDSRFLVVTHDPAAYVVALCRKQGRAPGRYGDVAVIQHNRQTGATCFYQASGDLDGKVRAPAKGTAAWSWLTPQATANVRCVRCHDNGPLIRSPYLTQLTGPNRLPGAGDTTFNRDQPYSFVGEDFAGWRAFTVEVAGNPCNGCHRMGVSSEAGIVGNDGSGTALDLGLRATAPAQVAKNPHSVDSPIWMMPGQITHAAASEAAAKAIHDCALRVREPTLPDSPSCRIRQFTGMAAPSVPGRFTAVFRPAGEAEVQVYGVSFDDYLAKYDQLWPQGFRLASLQPYVVDGRVHYKAVFRSTGGEEVELYDATLEAFLARYDALWPLGFRLHILQPYVIDRQVRYTAVWQRTFEGEHQVFGWTYEDFQRKYDELWPLGFRLHILQPYVLDGRVLYTAVWRPTAAVEHHVFGKTFDEYRRTYDALWPLGFRLAILKPHLVDGQLRYSAVWRPGGGGEFQLYDVPYADFRKTYDALWNEGFRLQILQTY